MASPATYRATNGVDAGDGRTLSGYALRWFDGTAETTARIDSPREGRFIEIAQRGCAAKCISERGHKIKILYQHGASSMTGSAPLAEPFTDGGLREDEIGLRYETRLLDGVPDLIVSGLRASAYSSSIGFSCLSETYDEFPRPTEWNPDAWPVRRLTGIKLNEISVVTFPAYPAASAGVRSLTEEVEFGRFVGMDEAKLQRLADAYNGGPTVGTTPREREAFARMCELPQARMNELAAYWRGVNAEQDAEQKEVA